MIHICLGVNRDMDLAKATADDFAELIDESFAVDADGTAPLVLTKVEAKSPVSGPGRQSFALLFHAAGETVLPQQIYRLDNAATGSIDLFLVPIAQDDDGVTYEAIFS